MTTQNNLLKSITKSTELMYEIISKQSYGETQLMVTCTVYWDILHVCVLSCVVLGKHHAPFLKYLSETLILIFVCFALEMCYGLNKL